MDVIIDETGKMETLLIFDRRTGCDWSYDLIGGAGPFSSIGFYRGEDGEFHTNQETFEWWEQYIDMYNKFEDELMELREKYGSSEVDEAIFLGHLSLSNDYDSHDAETKLFIETLKEMLEDDKQLADIRKSLHTDDDSDD